MRAIATTGGSEELRVTELPDPVPGANEVLVRMALSAINAADYKVLDGHFVGNVLHGKGRPLVVGYDVVGTVEAFGAGVTAFAADDEVFGFLPYTRATTQGAFAELVAVPASALARRPEGLSGADAATLGTSALTALQAYRDHGQLQAGQRVLVVGAAGGVGSVGVAIAKTMGAEVTGLCSAATAELVRGLGAAHVIDYRASDALAGDPTYDVIFDAAAANSYGSMRHLLNPGGTYVTTLPSAGLVTGKLIAAFSGHRCAFISVNPTRADLELVASWAGDMTLAVDSTYPVAKLAEALDRIKRGGMRGRILIEVGGGFGESA